MTFWRDDNVNCVLKGKELVKWSKSLPEEGKPFEKTKWEHMACFGDFKIQVYMGHEDKEAGEIGRATSRGIWDVTLRNSAVILGAMAAGLILGRSSWQQCGMYTGMDSESIRQEVIVAISVRNEESLYQRGTERWGHQEIQRLSWIDLRSNYMQESKKRGGNLFVTKQDPMGPSRQKSQPTTMSPACLLLVKKKKTLGYQAFSELQSTFNQRSE